jgi:lysophospholipase L1-like esterase
MLAQNFHLRPGDRVVFYGDSITDSRLYTNFTETFVLTRYPQLPASFVHSGWGGDRVYGGAGGGIAQRLQRDVLAYNPTVVTIMLGMNDGRYRAFDQQIFDIYSTGYKNIVKTLKSSAPNARLTAIQPSPYDDVTRAPTFPGGYNAVLLKFSDFLGELAKAEGLHLADLNKPVTQLLVNVKKANASEAARIIPDRVHPGPAGHLIMASALLKSWNARGEVSSLTVDAEARKIAHSSNTTAAYPTFTQTGITWSQTDSALPMPVDHFDPLIQLTLAHSDFQQTLNRQMLTIEGLPAGPHTLLIDGGEVVTKSAAEWAAGVNLADYPTPMWAQAFQVHALTTKHTALHQTRWRNVQVPLANDSLQTLSPAMAAIDAAENELIAAQRRMAQPVPRTFELRHGASAFQPLFNGTSLDGWHISQTNHHGQTQGWKVENGVLTGTQDRPGHGGILLTNSQYKNFEVQLEINPDFGADGGLFLRATEKGEAYQVLLDYLDGGAIGGVYGERLQGVKTLAPPTWSELYRRGQWNHLRARIEGDVPRIQVWLNGVKMTDFKDTENHLPGGATQGHVAVQVHGGNRWVPGMRHRFRNLQIRDLR